MALSEAQLAAWSRAGANASSATAYASIQNAIKASTALTGHNIEVYLQGSYKNSTNIRGESDVDIVVQCHDVFFYGLERLDPYPIIKSAVKERIDALPDATYSWDTFRSDVLAALMAYYGAGRLKNGNKCLAVADAGGTGISADVVPCFDHRLYVLEDGVPTVVDGMAFLTRTERRRVENYPKRHYENGVLKNAAASQNYKPLVRIFKNARSALVDAGAITDATAPSYFVECMVYNVPSARFAGSTWVQVYGSVLSYLCRNPIDAFICGNDVVPLFGPSPEQWNVDDARVFLDYLLRIS